MQSIRHLTREEQLNTGFRRYQPSSIKGTRTRHFITFNPSRAYPGEIVRVRVPKLKEDSCLVPDSFFLSFDFKSDNTTSWFKNNLGKLLMDRFEIKVSGHSVYSNDAESVIGVYRDLWLKSAVRSVKGEDGIASLAIRKMVSKNDEANTDAGAVLHEKNYGTRQRIHLGQILKDHGLYTGYNQSHYFEYYVKLPPAADIMEAQDLCSTQAMEVTGNGKQLIQTQHGILLEITKKATAKDLTCYVFTLCDALINLIGGDTIFTRLRTSAQMFTSKAPKTPKRTRPPIDIHMFTCSYPFGKDTPSK